MNADFSLPITSGAVPARHVARLSPFSLLALVLLAFVPSAIGAAEQMLFSVSEFRSVIPGTGPAASSVKAEPGGDMLALCSDVPNTDSHTQPKCSAAASITHH